MTVKEILLEDFDLEMANTRRILERIPEDNPEYKPHAKSFAIGKLSMHVATLPLFAKYIMTMPDMDLANNGLPRPDMTFRTREVLLTTFEQSVNEAKAALAAVSEAALAEHWKFCFGEHVISNDTRSKTYRNMFLNHLIHHRAQLGVYLRLNDIPVPGLYGPSADEPFNP
jgi:uncharacterized damage-inducible protein DinB